MRSSTATADGWVRPIEGAPEAGAFGEKAILYAYVLLCCASLVPFLAIAQPPIVDFANHAARLTLACRTGDPAVAAMYLYHLGIIPNLAIDLVNAPLCGVVGPAMVLRLVTATSLSLIYFSTWLIQRKLFGCANAFLFALPAIAFNLVTTMGYINFLAGVAIACLLAALTIGREHRFGSMVPVCNASGLLIFFCHVFALAFAMLIVFGLTARGARLSARRLTAAAFRTAILFALPLALLAFVPTAHEHFSIGFAHKIRTIPALFMAQHVSPGVYGLVLLGPLFLLLKDKAAKIDDRMRLPLLVVAAFVLVSPCSLQDAVDIDSRMLVALAYLFFASLRPCRSERELTLALGSVAGALVAFQLWAAATIWVPFSAQVDELRHSSTILPAKSKVLTIASTGPELIANPLAYSHLTSYVTIERRIFNPLEFTGVGMQPLKVTPAYAAVDTPTGQPYSPELANRFILPDPSLAELARKNNAGFALGWPHKFDYVIFYHFGRPYNFNPAVLEEIRRGSFFSILKVRRPSGQADTSKS